MYWLRRLATAYFCGSLAYFYLANGPDIIANNSINDFFVIVIFVLIPGVFIYPERPSPDAMRELD